MPGPTVASPLTLGPLSLPNRLLAAPMTCNLAGPEGEVTAALLQHYRRLAGSGVAMVIVESVRVSPEARASSRNLAAYSAVQAVGLRALAEVIRQSGARSCLQLWHSGSRSSEGPWAGRPCADFSAPRLAAARAQFVAAALRAVEAGFDAVEIHAAHGYLLHELLCPHTNPQGTHRSALLLEIAAQTASAVGATVPVLVRLSAACDHPGGVTLTEVGALAERLQAGGVAALSLSAGHNSVSLLSAPPSDTPRGYLLSLSAAVKQLTSLPVLVAGRLHERATIDAALAAQSLDGVLAGRALLADRHWASRLLAGKPVTACIYCNRCYDGLKAGLALRCRNSELRWDGEDPCRS